MAHFSVSSCQLSVFWKRLSPYFEVLSLVGKIPLEGLCNRLWYILFVCESFTENGIQFVSGFVHLIVFNTERLVVNFIEIRIMIVYDPPSFLTPLTQQQQQEKAENAGLNGI